MVVYNDYMYIYNKKTLVKSLYGEIQNDYNISLTLDETLDSCQVVVYNHIEEELKPYTICYLAETQTWWVVQTDTSKRYNNDKNALYEHTIQLVGAIYLLNARDMTNCGFNANRYTYYQFLTRLGKMINFELPISFQFNYTIKANAKVTYLKTFENYTPYSAIREMADGFNSIPKMTFLETNSTLTSAIVSFVSKRGLIDENALDGSTYFTNAEQTIKSDKSSYGSVVVSNVQNCVSPNEIRYPAIGGVKLTSDSKTINYSFAMQPTDVSNNAMVRLPSPVYKMNKMLIYKRMNFREVFGGTNYSEDFYFYGTDNNVISKIQQVLASHSVIYTMTTQDIDTITSVCNNSIIELKNGGYWEDDGSGGDLWFGDNITIATYKYVLNDKKHYETCKDLQRTTYWEQGSDLVKNFDFINHDNDNTGTSWVLNISGNRYILDYLKTPSKIGVDYRYAFYYVPMSDLKVKVNNDIFEKDINLFNQNGKLVDSNAVSKLLNSHSISISSNEIMKSKNFYDFSSVPRLGKRVLFGSDYYVINNISLDFIQNDNYGYLIYGQFVMSKDIACKSTMISANSNIRDYDCPQQNNIYRIQNYRDVFFLDYQENITETSYIGLDNAFVFNNSTCGLGANYSVFVKVQDDDFITLQNPNGYYYYVLGTSRYDLSKQTIIQCNFNDNNIIGYESGNSYKLITPQNLLPLSGSAVNTPISYVDDYGQLDELELVFVDEQQLRSAYQGYEATIGSSVTLPETIYVRGSNNCDFKITEDDYKKDGLEIPVFQYSAQVINHGDIIVGDKLMSGFRDNSSSYRYYCKFYENYITEENTELSLTNAYQVSFSKISRVITITINGNTEPLLNKNIAFFVNYTNNDNQVVNELLFAVNKCKVSETNELVLIINNVKLK